MQSTGEKKRDVDVQALDDLTRTLGGEFLRYLLVHEHECEDPDCSIRFVLLPFLAEKGLSEDLGRALVDRAWEWEVARASGAVRLPGPQPGVEVH